MAAPVCHTVPRIRSRSLCSFDRWHHRSESRAADGLPRRERNRPIDRSRRARPTSAVPASSRYTPKAEKKPMVPPQWIPVIMLVLLIAGGSADHGSKYLIFTDSNIPTFLGLACILGGLWTATKWRMTGSTSRRSRRSDRGRPRPRRLPGLSQPVGQVRMTIVWFHPCCPQIWGQGHVGPRSVVERRDLGHVLETVPRRRRILVRRHRQPHLHPADVAPIPAVHLAQLAGRRRVPVASTSCCAALRCHFSTGCTRTGCRTRPR